jgi:putative transposase
MDTRKAYPTDLKDEEWDILRELLPEKRTPPERTREYINGILYVLRTGCAWRMLPHDLPNWSTVNSYFRKRIRDGSWERINDALREQVRVKAGREAEPSVVIVDSQSVKTTEKGGLAAMTAANR